MDKDELRGKSKIITIQEQAYDYLRTVSPFKWHDLNEVPEDIFDEVWSVIDRGTLDGKYNFGLNVEFSNLFMKTIRQKL